MDTAVRDMDVFLSDVNIVEKIIVEDAVPALRVTLAVWIILVDGVYLHVAEGYLAFFMLPPQTVEK